MRQAIPKLHEIPEEERTPLVVMLLEIIHQQREEIQALKDEIARLKGQKPKPKIRPSRLSDDGKKRRKKRKKRAGSKKRKKSKNLEIHDEVVVQPPDIPKDAEPKGYETYTVQDIVLRPHNTRYLLARWALADGTYLVAKPPVELRGGHFGPALVSFILYQYYHAHVTQPLIHEQLLELGVDISSGQVNRIITEGKEQFHAEKDEILRVGLEVSRHVHVDDTGARHQGRNGFCTHIGNELFAWFQSTASKSRINFLELLRAGESDYVLNEDAFDYMRAQKMPNARLKLLVENEGRIFDDKEQWNAALVTMGITKKRHVRIATEGALLGSVLSHGLNPDLAIVSDDAGQFNVLLHALCWIHAERTLARLVGFSERQRQALQAVRTQVWELYRDLKAFKKSRTDEQKVRLEQAFDDVFTQKTCFTTLNLALKRLHANKSELLLVLDRPDIPLHNNPSERDIREYVKKRKISGSTRSELGRRCRDTFASLKKTCRKLGVSFWAYLTDRVSGSHNIRPLPETIRRRALEANM